MDSTVQQTSQPSAPVQSTSGVVSQSTIVPSISSVKPDVTWRRFFAFLLDYIPMGILLFIMAFLVGTKTVDSEGGISWNLEGIWSEVYLILFILYFSFFEWKTGQTFGMKLLKIKVMSATGTGINFMQALIRNVFLFIDIGFFFIGIFMILFSTNRQRLGDKVAGTIVTHV